MSHVDSLSPDASRPDADGHAAASLASPVVGADDLPPVVLDVQSLSVRIAGEAAAVQAVSALSLSVRHGQTFALVGESGSGKSMTALALLRLLPDAARMSAAHVRLGADELTALPERAMRSVRGARVGMVFQDPSSSLNPVMTIGRQLMEVLQAHTPLRGAALRERAQWWLQRVGIADAAQRLSDYPFQFSGGQKQRIMIAIALAAGPRVLIADEPTTALDVLVQAQVLALLQDIQREMGLAILLVTHDLAVVRQVADHVALMHAGRIVECAPAATFFASPRHPYALALLAAVPSHAKRGTRLSAGGERKALPVDGGEPRMVDAGGTTGAAMPVDVQGTQQMSQAPDAVAPLPAAHASPVLQVEGLTVSYAPRGLFRRRAAAAAPVVRQASFTLHAGETLALLGESGCGKTTLAKAVLRLLGSAARVEGSVRLLGRDLLTAGRRDLAAMRRDIQIVFQDPYASLDPRMAVGDILDEGMRTLRPEWGRDERKARAQSLLADVGLPADTLTRYPHAFSGGQRQRIAIARALAVEPSVLVCDEPTSALDVSVQAQLLDLLHDLQQRTGMAYLFITHNVGVVEYLADRVAVMHQGEIIELTDVDTLLTHPSHAQTQRLLAAVPRL